MPMNRNKPVEGIQRTIQRHSSRRRGSYKCGASLVSILLSLLALGWVGQPAIVVIHPGSNREQSLRLRNVPSSVGRHFCAHYHDDHQHHHGDQHHHHHHHHHAYHRMKAVWVGRCEVQEVAVVEVSI